MNKQVFKELVQDYIGYVIGLGYIVGIGVLSFLWLFGPVILFGEIFQSVVHKTEIYSYIVIIMLVWHLPTVIILSFFVEYRKRVKHIQYLQAKNGIQEDE